MVNRQHGVRAALSPRGVCRRIPRRAQLLSDLAYWTGKGIARADFNQQVGGHVRAAIHVMTALGKEHERHDVSRPVRRRRRLVQHLA